MARMNFDFYRPVSCLSIQAEFCVLCTGEEQSLSEVYGGACRIRLSAPRAVPELMWKLADQRVINALDALEYHTDGSCYHIPTDDGLRDLHTIRDIIDPHAQIETLRNGPLVVNCLSMDTDLPEGYHVALDKNLGEGGAFTKLEFKGNYWWRRLPLGTVLVLPLDISTAVVAGELTLQTENVAEVSGEHTVEIVRYKE